MLKFSIDSLLQQEPRMHDEAMAENDRAPAPVLQLDPMMLPQTQWVPNLASQMTAASQQPEMNEMSGKEQGTSQTTPNKPAPAASASGRLACPVCGRNFEERHKLTRHMRVHTGERPYKCQVCDKAFGHATTLSNHMATHSQDKPFKCGNCGAAFKLKKTLKTHSRIHLAHKPYICEVCGKGFHQKGQCEKHRLTHSEKRHKCNICNTSFRLPHGLDCHIRTHFEKKPYECVVCGKDYCRPSDLQRHVLKLHGPPTDESSAAATAAATPTVLPLLVPFALFYTRTLISNVLASQFTASSTVPEQNRGV